MKLFPTTATVPAITRLRVGSVIQTVTEEVETPFKVKVWLVPVAFPLMATMTKFKGDGLLLFLKAVTLIPAEGTAVAPMR